MSLKEQGWRFILRGATFRWESPTNLEPSDIDCTDMPDDELQALIDFWTEPLEPL